MSNCLQPVAMASGSAVSAARALPSGSGMGTMNSRSGTPGAGAYEGTTNERGEPDGQGKRVFASGHVYEGRWKDGRCDGFGVFTYPDGQVFEGEWRDGRRNGQGKLSMPNGETIAGTWVDDNLTGPVRRWMKASEQPPAPIISGSVDKRMVYDAPPGQAPAEEGGGDVAWLRESHDVIWQLNVELQMENERLVAENRRLRLKLRQMIQKEQEAPKKIAEESQNVNDNNRPGSASGPKVVEGRLRRKSGRGDDERRSRSGRSQEKWLTELLQSVSGKADNTNDAQSFLNFLDKGGSKKKNSDRYLLEGSGTKLSESEGRQRIMDELIKRAETELSDALLGRDWESLKRIGRAGETERFARHQLNSALDEIKRKSPKSESELEASAREVRAALDAVLGWPEGLRRIESGSGSSGERLLEARELQLDGCGIGENGAGAVCVILRESRSLESIDLASNGLGDAGATMLADVLRSSTALRKLRLNANDIRDKGGGALAAMLSTNRNIKVDLRSNRFDSLNESALRRAGGDRVIISESDRGFDEPKKDTSIDYSRGAASDYLKYGDRPSSSASASRDADAFLAFGDASRRSEAPRKPSPPRASDADAFLSFSSGGRGGGGGAASRSVSGSLGADFITSTAGPPAKDATSASAFLEFSGAGGSGSSSAFASEPVPRTFSSGSKTSTLTKPGGMSSVSKSRGVSFAGGGSASSSGLGAGAASATDFLASLGDDF